MRVLTEKLLSLWLRLIQMRPLPMLVARMQMTTLQSFTRPSTGPYSSAPTSHATIVVITLFHSIATNPAEKLQEIM